MKNIYVCFLSVLISSTILAQIDTSNGRYYNAVFSTVNVTSNVTYGSNAKFNGPTQTLLMDIYQPAGDTVSKRPLLIFAHGGSFIGGTKTDGDVVELCNRFAKMGYVTVSMEYRVGFYPIDSVNAIKAVIRAVQDMKAAVRFFRKDAATTNSYKINSDFIFAAGSSAGAFMALHLAYMDKNSEAYQIISSSSLTALGGLDGNSGNPGYTSNVKGVVNLCGAIGFTSWLEPGDIPLVSLHGPNDQTVPYATQRIYVSGFPIMVVSGSSSIHQRADDINIENAFYTYQGAGHVPYSGSSASAIAYMDTTVNFVKEFLRPLLGGVSVGMQKLKVESATRLHPNPSEGTFELSLPKAANYAVEIFDMTGKCCFKIKFNGRTTVINSELPGGIYIVKLTDENQKSQYSRLVIK